MEDANPELESFREQWRREVIVRSNKDWPPSVPSKLEPKTPESRLAPTSAPRREDSGEEEDIITIKKHHDLADKDFTSRLGGGGILGNSSNSARRGSVGADDAPLSALEHYEKAVEKESQGNLGDSLDLYRKAYRMDASVDKSYGNKYFPPSPFLKPLALGPSSASWTVPTSVRPSLQGLQSSTAQLITKFASTPIAPAPPPTEGSLPPACPIATIPSEILVEVLVFSAVADIASFVKLAQVCKRFAYLVATEERVWKRVCCGSEFGFGAMHYDYRCSIFGEPLPRDNEGHLHSHPLQNELGTTAPLDTSPVAFSLPHTTYSSWRLMFHARPRIRFSGVYISTVNYIRPGASSTTQVSWNTPVHIVTYYRYLRFFRDGTVLSLLSVAEPKDVVQHLTKENVAFHSTGAAGSLPSAIVKQTLRGRWRLSGPAGPSNSEEPEGDLHIETEGVDEKYFYKLHLAIRSASSANNTRKPKGNKLVWKGFWSYNRLTDDWAEFGLRNDRAFFWSRVKSYGL
ncbi:MAG: hypothetical protein M1840_002652 [Geoglossum simile]|nr:MAG: hypothetical protein M1840_002652 [Geoglossum simile]